MNLKPHADKWVYLENLRDPQYWVDKDFLDYKDPRTGFKICSETGYITYDERPELEEHYRKSYRKNVQAMNLITANRKIEYHKKFLGVDHSGKRVLDFGCASGATLNWIRSCGARVKGYELTDGFVNYARNVYSLDIVQSKFPDEPADTYDLVILYHVLEHVPEPVALLSSLRECMKPDGMLYLSVPVWGECLDEPGGTPTLDFESLYHIDHIQVFSRTSIRNVIGLCGMEIMLEDDQVYGHTFLLRKGDGKPRKIVKEDSKTIIKNLEAQKKAIEIVRDDPSAAYQVWPDYPDAYVFQSLKIQKDVEEMKRVLELGLKNCSQKFKLWQQLGTLHMQWDGDRAQKGYQGPKYNNAVKYAEECFDLTHTVKPNNESYLYYKGMIEHQYKGNHRDAIRYWQRLLEVNPSRYSEVHQWIGLAAGREWLS